MLKQQSDMDRIVYLTPQQARTQVSYSSLPALSPLWCWSPLNFPSFMPIPDMPWASLLHRVWAPCTFRPSSGDTQPSFPCSSTRLHDGLSLMLCYNHIEILCCSVMSNSLQPHRLQHARLFCPLPSPGACSNSCPLSQWHHPTISSSVIPFFSWPQSFPELGSFPMSQPFASGGQSIGASTSALPMNIQDWFPVGLTGWISLQSKGLSRVFSNTAVQKYQFFHAQPSLWSNSHIHTWLLETP